MSSLGAGAFGRLWVPLVVVVAVALGGFVVWRLHGTFGNQPQAGIGVGRADEIVPLSRKRVTYELFGPPGTAGQVSYLDDRARSQRVMFTELPWSYSLVTSSPAIFAHVVAQGDGSILGCRIVVDGAVKDEQSVDAARAQVSCLAKSA